MSFDGRPANRVAQETSGSWGAFLLVTYSLGKQRKVTRQKGEKRPNKHPQLKNNLLQLSHLAWIPAYAGMTKVDCIYRSRRGKNDFPKLSKTIPLKSNPPTKNPRIAWVVLLNDDAPASRVSIYISSRSMGIKPRPFLRHPKTRVDAMPTTPLLLSGSAMASLCRLLQTL